MILPAMLAGATVGVGVLVAARGLIAPPLPRLERRLVELYEPLPSAGHSSRSESSVKPAALNRCATVTQT